MALLDAASVHRTPVMKSVHPLNISPPYKGDLDMRGRRSHTPL